MAGVDDRHYDVKDILDRATYGWVAPPNKPTFVVEDRDNPRSGYFSATCPDDGIIIICKDYTFDTEILSESYYETRVWSFPCILIAQSAIKLQGMFDQMREVFNRYTRPTANTPFSTSTLGTSTTYSLAKIEKGTIDQRIPMWTMDVTVYLVERFAEVVVA